MTLNTKGFAALSLLSLWVGRVSEWPGGRLRGRKHWRGADGGPVSRLQDTGGIIGPR